MLASLTTSSLGPAVSEEAGRERMRRMALEARARSLASGAQLSATSAAAPGAGPAIVLPPQTVTFDLEKGSRTIVYGDDIVVSEPFDVGRVKDLVASGPAAK